MTSNTGAFARGAFLVGKALTLREALGLAEEHWESKGPSSRMMSKRASTCLDISGKHCFRVDSLSARDGTAILTGLQNQGLAKGSVQAYYAAFRRMVKLAGGSTEGWPTPGKPPRRVRQPMKADAMDALEKELRRPKRWGWRGPSYSGSYGRRGDEETADLLILLRATGMRVDVEALSDNWVWDAGAKVLTITGKGGHQREVPVEDAEAIALLGDKPRLDAMRRYSYSGHMKRWNNAVTTLKDKVATKLPTPHSIRHAYATRVYHASGKDIVLVKELLGHADVGTTARYIGVDVEQAREAIRRAA